MLGEQSDQAVVIDAAGGGDDGARRHVAGTVEGANRPARYGRDHLGAAHDRPAERVPAEDRCPGQVVHELLGRVLDHGDLLEHDLPLRVQVVERGRVDHVGHHVEGGLEVVVHDARIDDGVLARGQRVELAADPVEDLRDVLGGVRAGSLEEQVLDEVAEARTRVVLVSRARPDPEADRDRANAVEPLGDDPLAVGERGEHVILHVSSERPRPGSAHPGYRRAATWPGRP